MKSQCDIGLPKSGVGADSGFGGWDMLFVFA